VSATTLPTRQPCPSCGAALASVLCEKDGKTGQPLRSVVCHGCALVRIDPLPSAEELDAYYRNAYRSDYKGTLTPRLKHVWRAAHAALDRLAWVTPLLQAAPRPARSVLDIGSGGGEFVALLAQRGWAASGLEPNRGYAEFSRQTYQLDVDVGTLWETPAQRQFDAVTCFHVLEHLRDPVDGLRRMAQWLAPGGRLFVEVPSVLYPGGAPGNTFFRAHLFHFAPQTLARCGQLAGLNPLWVDPDPASSNVRVAFEHAVPGTSAPALVAEEVARAVAQVHRVNAQRTWLRYATSAQAPAKFAGRVRRIREESTLERRFATPAALLDALYGKPATGAPGEAAH
jgi:SAM-dependent methyltransferase